MVTPTKRSLSFEAFILAGGVSSRMRRAKHLLDFGGVPLILQTARLVAPLVRKITVIGAKRNTVPVGIRAIPDDDFGIRSEVNSRNGPLAGIVTALSHSHSAWNLIVACDMPYLNIRWLAWLLDRAAKSDAEVVIPRTTRGVEPLAAVYHRDCANPVARSLLRRVPKIVDALKLLRLEILNEPEWREFDPDGLVLNNLNTPTEYEQAQTWFRNQGYLTVGGKLERTPQPPLPLEIRHRPTSLPRPFALPSGEREAKPLIAFPLPLAKRRNGTE
ncbi:MAG TPA: molybdenum cofactor guanylyltransferase [Candidatus Acidoferrales bacterium]|nr:molybdenum cofactor guanylyltransferase [Candidatus Acidoferrales bacterium]